MTRFFIGLIGLAIFAAGSLAGQTSVQGGETGCCEQGCPQGCPECCGNGCGNGCCDRCPRCGCCMEPVCHMTCDTKKETVHKYCCTCKWICLPPVTPACGCKQCDNSNNNCEDCGCCQIRKVHKLVVYPTTKETPITKCTVLWTCPKCGYGPCGDGVAAPGTTVQPPAPAPTMPAPAPAKEPSRLPPPPKTTDAAPQQPVEVATRGLQGF
jgi:hypothetical protein